MCKDQINRERSYAGYKPIGKLCCERSAGNMFGEAELAKGAVWGLETNLIFSYLT